MDVNEYTEPTDQSAPDPSTDPAPPIQSRFLFVDVAALRAKQLRKGARVRIAETEAVHVPKKAERIAMEEVRRGLVYYDVAPRKPASSAEEAEA
jgi:DNA-directed RNA polymerase subunit K/omega